MPEAWASSIARDLPSLGQTSRIGNWTYSSEVFSAVWRGA